MFKRLCFIVFFAIGNMYFAAGQNHNISFDNVSYKIIKNERIVDSIYLYFKIRYSDLEAVQKELSSVSFTYGTVDSVITKIESRIHLDVYNGKINLRVMGETIHSSSEIYKNSVVHKVSLSDLELNRIDYIHFDSAYKPKKYYIEYLDVEQIILKELNKNITLKGKRFRNNQRFYR